MVKYVYITCNSLQLHYSWIEPVINFNLQTCNYFFINNINTYDITRKYCI